MAETVLNLREEPIKKLFFKYLIPSTLGMLLLSINTVIDGIFIGHAIGPDGLAAVNITIPIYATFYAISFWIGMGGAMLFSMHIGKGEPRKAQSVFTQSFTYALLLTTVICIVFLLNIQKLASVLGANQVIMPYVLDYMSVLLLFGGIFVLDSLLSVFVRNDGNPNLVMVAFILTAVLNILLNYIFMFIFDWGVSGAAYATVFATAIGLFIMISHVFRKTGTLRFIPFRFSKDILLRLLSIGFPSFVTEISVAIVALGYNISFMRMLGEIGVSSFAVVNYIHEMVLLIFIGIGSSLQPIVSFHYGANLHGRIRETLKTAVITSLVFGVLAVGIGWLLAGPLTTMFNIEDRLLYDITVSGIYLFFINYLFLGYNLVYATYYQSIGKLRLSLVITFMRSVILVLFFLFILPQFIGVNGIWLAVPAAEGITALVVLCLNRLNSKQNEKLRLS